MIIWYINKKHALTVSPPGLSGLLQYVNGFIAPTRVENETVSMGWVLILIELSARNSAEVNFKL